MVRFTRDSGPDRARQRPTVVGSEPRDISARLLELGLALLLLVAPWPLGAVRPLGRNGLELAALLLLLLWLARAALRPTPLPPRTVRIAAFGLLLLALVQALPLGAAIVDPLSPAAREIRQTWQTPEPVRAVERDLLGVDPLSLDRPASLSLDPGATASALRTGVALVGLLLVATTVTAVRGVRLLALALLVSAAFQGLYGLLVLVSGHDRIWHLPKQYNLHAATGTFVSNNHFSCLLAMSLAVGLALVLDRSRPGRATGLRRRVLSLFDPEGSRTLLLGLLLTVGLAGLLTSFSRAGIAVGLLGLGLTALAGGRAHRLRARIVVALLLLAAAALPLMQLGTDRLLTDYLRAPDQLQREGGRATVWKDSLRMVGAFPLTGAGFGTFAAVYPRFRSPEVRKFYDHAHNDPLQVVVEGGVLGALGLTLLLVPLVSVLLRAIAGAKGVLAVGLAAGLAAFLLHTLVDFNAHIPANAATAAVLAGGLLGMPWIDRT